MKKENKCNVKPESAAKELEWKYQAVATEGSNNDIVYPFNARSEKGERFYYSRKEDGRVCLKSENIEENQEEGQEDIAFIAITMQKFALQIEIKGRLNKGLIDARSLASWLLLVDREQNIKVADTMGRIYEKREGNNLYNTETGEFLEKFQEDVKFLTNWHLHHITSAQLK